ncbi:MAG: hypothetical protein WBR18_04580 [Anaerolineales bacterium]
MITLRCTRKLLDYLEKEPVNDPPSSTGKLGDWYANLVPTHAGDLIILVSVRTLVTVAVPAWQKDHLLSLFRARVRNLLMMLEVSQHAIERELGHYQDVRSARTASRSVLGSMNDIAKNYQFIAERDSEQGTLSLSDAEYQLSEMPSIARDLFPADAARELLEPRSASNGAS